MTSDLTLLLATLAIMTGALVITGVPTKLGAILIDLAGVNLAAMVVLAFVFGALLGTGLPPAPTYILVAIVIAPPMIRVGVNPWVVHFFAFFLGVWGELTPPTSLVAAVTAKIANASFYTTLNRALQICVSLFTLMAGVFVHPELVIEPGVAQFGAAGLILTATIGITFSLQARYADSVPGDISIRLVLAALSLLVLLCPDDRIATAACVPVLLLIGYWLVKRRDTFYVRGEGLEPVVATPIPVPADRRYRARPDAVARTCDSGSGARNTLGRGKHRRRRRCSSHRADADAAEARELQSRTADVEAGDEAQNVDLHALDPADRHAEEAAERELEAGAAGGEAEEAPVGAPVLADGGRRQGEAGLGNGGEHVGGERVGVGAGPYRVVAVARYRDNARRRRGSWGSGLPPRVPRRRRPGWVGARTSAHRAPSCWSSRGGPMPPCQSACNVRRCAP